MVEILAGQLAKRHIALVVQKITMFSTVRHNPWVDFSQIFGGDVLICSLTFQASVHIWGCYNPKTFHGPQK